MFSSLDACGAYQAVRIEPGSQACTAFISPFGTFQCIRMLFGLSNAGSVYSRMLDVAMKKVDRNFRMSYLVDILTFSGESWAHFRHLTQVVLAHMAAGIKIQPCKTKLLQSEVEYLGHKISKGGVSMIPKYLQKITDWPVLKTGKEVASFLGFARYYQTFIIQYSVLTNWLNGIKKVEKFLWNKEIERDLYSQGGIQAFPDFGVGDLFILTTDWSKENITGELSQVQDGKKRFLGCWGRKCIKYEQNYPSYMVELLAVL